MPVPINNSRPSLPYAPTQSLPNNTRFGILTTTQRPPTAEMLDAEFNALTDDVNMLAAAINDVQAGSIPGANDSLNANKVLKTDGDNNLSWTYVTNAEIEVNAVVEQKLAAQAVTTPKIGDAAVTTQKIAQNAVATNQIIDANVTTVKLADANVTTAKIADAAITTAKLANQAVTQGQIANAAVGTPQLIDGNVTTAKIAGVAVTTQQLADAAVTNPKIGLLAVKAPQISSANANLGDVLTSNGAGAATFSAISSIGKILQVRSYTYSLRTDTANSGTNFTSFAVPFAVTITPLSNNSSIFIFISANLAAIANAGGSMSMALFKNNVKMTFNGDNGLIYNQYQKAQELYDLSCFSRLIVDKNNQLNQLSYELRGYDSGGYGVILNQSSGLTAITSSNIYAIEVDI